jgi:hypothetical protein
MGRACSTMPKGKAKTVSVSNHGAKRTLGISRGRWKDKVLHWLKWQAFVHAVINIHLNNI